MGKYLMWLVVVAALLVGIVVGFAAERQRAIVKMEDAKLLYQNQIDKINAENKKLTAEKKQLQMSLTPTPTGAIKVTPSSSIMKK